MSVITITITASVDETIPGIPNSVVLETSEPATIFYTLNGCAPDLFSPIYLAPIAMPQSLAKVILSVYATNGSDSSAIITQEYDGDLSAVITDVNERLPHSAMIGIDNSKSNISLFPFGSGGPSSNAQYLNPGAAGTTVFNESLPATAIGWNGTGVPDGYTNAPYSSFQFRQVYSTNAADGFVYPGVGNLPATVEVIGKNTAVDYDREISSFADKIFDPRALVIYQDANTDDPTNPINVMRQDFSTVKTEIDRDGTLLYNSSLESPTTTGTYLKSHYNQRTNQITSYYFDSSNNRWIISSAPYQPTNKEPLSLASMVFARPGDYGGGARVFKWIPFASRRLL